ncbi:hypothetical protein GCM10027160_10610 [Streptomyces calidiresistens]
MRSPSDDGFRVHCARFRERVPGGESAQACVVDEGGGRAGEGRVVAGTSLVAPGQTAMAGLPRPGQFLRQTARMASEGGRKGAVNSRCVRTARLAVIATPGSCHLPGTMPQPLSRTNS